MKRSPSRLRAAVVLAAMTLSLAASAAATVLVKVEDLVVDAIGELGSESVEARYAATVVLARYPGFAERSIPVLRRALEDRDWPVRLGAARALEAVGPQAPDLATVAALARRLQDPSAEVRAAASFALAAIGVPLPTMLPLLERGAAGASPGLRAASATARPGLQRPAAADAAGGRASALHFQRLP